MKAVIAGLKQNTHANILNVMINYKDQKLSNPKHVTFQNRCMPRLVCIRAVLGYTTVNKRLVGGTEADQTLNKRTRGTAFLATSSLRQHLVYFR